MLQDRRQFERLTPNSPQLVLLDESKYSLLFDLSEGGLALEGFTAKNPQDVIALEFDLPQSSGCISARAEVAWTSGSGYRSGLRFLEMPDASRNHLREWISNASIQRKAALETGVEPEASTPREQLLLRPASTEVKEEERAAELPSVQAMPHRFNYNANQEDDEFYDGRAGNLATIVISVVLMSSLAFLMGYYWHQDRMARARRAAAAAARAAAAATKPPADAGVSADAAQGTSAPSASSAPLSLDSPGFVLQIAAMANEGNADAVSATLHQKNFAAFVFKHKADSFYRVAVGPFPDANSAAKTKSALEQQGFKPILKTWTPE